MLKVLYYITATIAGLMILNYIMEGCNNQVQQSMGYGRPENDVFTVGDMQDLETFLFFAVLAVVFKILIERGKSKKADHDAKSHPDPEKF